MPARYDTIGRTYARTRREDPQIVALIDRALADARTVINVGAGTGSYEPADRYVVAVEPSAVMIGQRGPDRVPAIQATAGSLPFLDDSFDAGLAIITIHHWDAEREAGVRELRRVVRGPVAILTFDAAVSARMWLPAEYLPEVAELDREIMTDPEIVAGWLGGDVAVETVPVARDTPDWTFAAFWAHPERVLDAEARAGTSGFARMDPAIVDRAVRAVERDLGDGTWDARHGDLRHLDEFDAGLRLILSR